MMENKLHLLEQNLFQFFYIFGLDSSLALSDEIYKQIKGQQKRIEFIQPKTITKFPQFRNTYANIADEVIIKHVFPKGFFIENKVTPPNHNVLFFSMDNFPFNELGKKVYYVAVVFYESLLDYHKIKVYNENFDKCQSINEGLNDNVKEDDIPLKNYYVPKAICLASLLPFPFEESLILKSLISNYSLDKNSSQVQIEKLIENLVLSIPYPPRGQYVVEFTFLNKTHTLSQTPINKVPNSSIVLQLMFAKFKVEEVIKIFKCILLELPILFFSPDSLTLSTICEGFLSLLFPFRYQWPHVSILPVNNYSLIEICDTFFFGINEEYNKYFFEKYYIEPETKTIYAVDIEKGEIHQLRPDQTVKQNIILGQTFDPFLETLSVFEQIEMPVHYKKKFHTRLVALAQRIKEGKEAKDYKNELDKIYYNPKIREDFFYFLVSILNDYAKYIRITPDCIQKLSYERLTSKQEVSIDKIYNVVDYISSIGGVEQVFYKRLLNTKMFKEFIFKKINPVTIEDKMEVLFFDERIVMKKNKYFFSRSVRTPLIESTVFENKSRIPIAKREKFSNSELFFMSQKENQKKALNYYKIILSNLKGDTIEIKTVIFPRLLYDNEFFNKNYIDIYRNNNMPQGCNIHQITNAVMETMIKDKALFDIYKETGYSFNLIQDNKKKHQDTNKNINEGKDNDYIELSWLIIFTLSFWYCDDKEKEERFYELLNVLGKIKTVQLFHHLFKSFENVIMFVYFGIMKYGSNAQRIKLFEEFTASYYLNYYIAYAMLCAFMTKDINLKVSKCNDKRFFQGMKVTLLMREYSKETEPTETSTEEADAQQKEAFPIRSLLNSYSDNNVEYIYFAKEYKCDKCLKTSPSTQEDKFKLPPLDEKGFKCPLCSEEFTPQATVQITDNKIETINIMTPAKLFQTVYRNYMTINSYQLDIETFRQKSPDLFWNLVFYFDYKELPFDFLIPYEKTKQLANRNDKNDVINVYSFGELIVSSNTLVYEYSNDPNGYLIEGEKKMNSQLLMQPQSQFKKEKKRGSFENRQWTNKDFIIPKDVIKKRNLTAGKRHKTEI